MIVHIWRFYCQLSLLLLAGSTEIGEIKFLDDIHRSNFKIGCPGRGPFSTVNSCVIICESDICENAKEICKELGDDCNLIVRARAGARDSLQGQAVELKRVGPDIRSQQNKMTCLRYGKQLSGTALGKRVAESAAANQFVVNQFAARNGTMMFLHMRKAGGMYNTYC